MTDSIVGALTASLAKEHLSRKVRLTSWLLLVVVESMQTGRYKTQVTGHRSKVIVLPIQKVS